MIRSSKELVDKGDFATAVYQRQGLGPEKIILSRSNSTMPKNAEIPTRSYSRIQTKGKLGDRTRKDFEASRKTRLVGDLFVNQYIRLKRKKSLKKLWRIRSHK